MKPGLTLQAKIALHPIEKSLIAGPMRCTDPLPAVRLKGRCAPGDLWITKHRLRQWTARFHVPGSRCHHFEKCWLLLDDEKLVGGFNPFEKYACQIGSFPQVGMKIKKIETTTQETFTSKMVATDFQGCDRLTLRASTVCVVVAFSRSCHLGQHWFK